MKVLIFDLEIYENDIFDIITSYLKYITIYKTNNKKEFIKKLEINQYDLLFLIVFKITSSTFSSFKNFLKLLK